MVSSGVYGCCSTADRWFRLERMFSSILSSVATSPLLPWLTILSVITFVGSLILIPWLILRMDSDYFVRHHEQVVERKENHPIAAVIIYLLRNSMGLFLMLIGIVMLILPGQGVLTMIIGLSIMDFPGKHGVIDKIIRNKRVEDSLNWIRRKGNKEELIFRDVDW